MSFETGSRILAQRVIEAPGSVLKPWAESWQLGRDGFSVFSGQRYQREERKPVKQEK